MKLRFELGSKGQETGRMNRKMKYSVLLLIFVVVILLAGCSSLKDSLTF